VCIETYCDNNYQFREKPGKQTNESCGQPSCNKGAVINYCVRQECDMNLNRYVCIESYWDENCQVKERVGTRTATRCGNDFMITATPVIEWPTITPGGGGDAIILRQPTPTFTPTPTFIPIPTRIITPILWSNRLTTENECEKNGGECRQNNFPCDENQVKVNYRCGPGYKCCKSPEVGLLKKVGIGSTQINITLPPIVRQHIALEKPTPTPNKAMGTTMTSVGECFKKNTCCGESSVCQGTGFLGLGKPVCQPCDIAGSKCDNGKCVKEECTENGISKLINNNCYVCVKLSNQSSGKYMAVGNEICKQNTKIESPQQLLTSLLNPEDQFELRKLAYKNTISDPNTGIGLKIAAQALRLGDYIGYGWGKITSGVSGILGNKTPTSSSLGNYYISQMEANMKAEEAGTKRKVTIGQALITGLTGAADMVSFGITKPISEKILKQTFKNEIEVETALKTQEAGIDLTNTVALIVPVGKGVSAVGNLTTKAGEKIAERSTSTALRTAARGLSTTGKLAELTGKIIERTSPESWAAPFIKSAPISTSLEVGFNAIANTKPVRIVGEASGKVISQVPIVAKTADVGKKIGSKVFDILVPRSALTYTPEEAARYLARDIKLSLAEEETIVPRLINKYRISPEKITDPKAFSVAIEEQLTKSGTKIDKKITETIESELTRLNDLPNRVSKFKDLKPADIEVVSQNVDSYSKKFSQIKNPDELAEAILHEWEKIDNRLYIDDPHQLAAAKRYAEEVVSLRSQNSLSNRIKTNVSNLIDNFRKRLISQEKKLEVEPIPQTTNQLRKQKFSFLERLTGKPKKIETEVLQDLKIGRISNSSDEIKNVLRNKGYAEKEIDDAVRRIQNEYQIFTNKKIPEVKPVNKPKIGRGSVSNEPIHDGVVQDAVFTRPESNIVAVADGVTGAGIKSADVAKGVVEKLSEGMQELVSKEKNIDKILKGLDDVARTLDSFYQEGSTTVAVGHVTPDGKLLVYQVGDCEVRIIRKGKSYHVAKLFNTDKSPMFKGKFLKPKETYGQIYQGWEPNMPNQIGGGGFAGGYLSVHQLGKGDRVVFASDGIKKALNEKEISEIVSRASSPQEAETNLIKEAINRGLKDDYSAVVIFY
jgi:serine/threonine protein phosphatase PrpC